MTEKSNNLFGDIFDEPCVSGSGQLVTSQSPLPASGSINAVSVKNVPFWRNFPGAWFLQLEAQFELAGIKQEETKFSHLLSALDESIFRELSDLITNPPRENKYTVFKNALISRLSSSENQKLKQLLTDLVLGDSQPSQLLREMRTLSNGKFSEDIIKSLWLQRLPVNTQAILSCNPGSLDELAACADKISEVSNKSEIYTMTATTSNSAYTQLARQVSELTNQVQQMSCMISRKSRRDINHRSKSRHRSFSRNRYTRNNDQCWYHYKFGKNAKKCIAPCAFSKNSCDSTN